MDATDRDLAIRAVLAEAGGKDAVSQAAVANVIRNRLNAGTYGSSVAKIVTAPYQFEPFLHAGTGKNNDPMRFSPASDLYRQAGNIVDAVFSGEHPDPTGGATHFYAPKLQADLGRSPPSWAQGQPTAQIGGHNFYHLEGGGTPGTGVVPTSTGGGDMAIGGGSSGAGGTPNDLQRQLLQAQLGAMQQGQQPIPHKAGLLGQLLFGPGGLSGVINQKLPNGILGGLFGGGGSAPAPAPQPAAPAPQPQAQPTQMAGATPPTPGGGGTGALAAMFGMPGGRPAPTTPFAPAPQPMAAAPQGASGGILGALASMFGAGGNA